MDISLARVVAAARERQATLTPEVAGYVILLAAQQAALTRSRVSAESVLLDEGGDVLLVHAGVAGERDIEAALRGLLRALIELCASPPPAIGAVASRGVSGDLPGLVAELSAALIPINHAAARRALARLYRETRRADVSIAPVAPQPVGDPPSTAGAGELEIDVVVEPDPGESQIESEASPASGPERAPEPPEEPPVDGAPVASSLDQEHAPALDVERPQYERARLEPSQPEPAEREEERPEPAARSELHELLAAFLPESRSLERMLIALRDMIGLELRPRRTEVASAAADVPR